MAALTTAERTNVAAPKDKAYEELKQAIVENEFEPGTPLSEESLAAEHGLSRTPIREVLQRLSRDGLVEIVRNKGAFVSRLDPRDMRELFEMREALEGFAARLAAQRMGDDEIAELDERFRSLKKGRRGVDAREFSAAGQDLHAAIHHASGNRRLMDALETICLHSRRAFRFSMAIPQRIETSLKEHLPIVIALKRRDPDAAEAAMRAHLRSAWRSLVAALANPHPRRAPTTS